MNEFELIEEQPKANGMRKIAISCGVDDGELKLSRKVAELLISQGNGYILAFPENIDDSNSIDIDISRDDPKLISAIEAVGVDNASGNKGVFKDQPTTMKIVEIPLDVKWMVRRDPARECEQVEEIHRTWR